MARKSDKKLFTQYTRAQKQIIAQFKKDMETDKTLQGYTSELSKIQDTDSLEFNEMTRKILDYLDTTCQQRLGLVAPTIEVPQKQ